MVLPALALLVGACAGSPDTPAAEVGGATTIAPPPADDVADEEPTGSAGSAVTAAPASAGCGAGTEVTVGGPNIMTVRSGAIDRDVGFHVPAGYDGATPLPVVLNLHPYASPANVHSSVSAMDLKSEEEGFIEVAPQGIGAIPYWNVPGNPGLADDVTFMGSLLDKVVEDLCVDERRIYVAGNEMGGQLGLVLACEMSDRIAAVATVAGVYLPERCDPARPVPVLAFHSRDDTWQLFEGGLGPGAFGLPQSPESEELIADIVIPSVPDFAEGWAHTNGCTGELTEQRFSEHVVHQSYEGCPEGGEVELYVMEGVGHAWPGTVTGLKVEELTGPSTNEIIATDVIWDFFESYAIDSAG
ncbi:MAG: hypothetical protein JJLCMIEE_03072 [Acidimicrobiales bacterium]|nr:hypothetical protein [Acidimicrobiales bacterium]